MTESINFGRSLTDVRQPRISAERLAAAQGHLLRYRIMAFVTGVVLSLGTIALILKYSAGVHLPATRWCGWRTVGCTSSTWS